MHRRSFAFTMARCWGVARGVPIGDMTMTANKDLKRLVRSRMKKTGESYSAARAQITRKNPTRAKPPAVVPGPVDYAAIAGMSNAAIKAKTGCAWDKWVKSLDYHGAERMSHREIADLVSETYKVPAWWTQTVTVGYERIKGLRARGQRRDGTFEASKSRTFPVPVGTLVDAWADSKSRKRWLGEPGVKVRTATAPKSMRIGWSDGSIIAINFMSKGAGKSSVAVQHTKLADRDTAEKLKSYWAAKLDALGEVLSV
jgi:hypothetical protein